MLLTTFLALALESGKITASEKNFEKLQINVENKKIDINVIDKNILKETISASTKSNGKSSLRGKIRKATKIIQLVRETRPLIRYFVEDLRIEGVTLTLSYKGDRVATIGSGANSRLTRFLTGTKGIEIDSLRRLAEISI